MKKLLATILLTLCIGGFVLAGTTYVDDLTVSNRLNQAESSVTNSFSGDVNYGDAVLMFPQGGVSIGSYTSGDQPGDVEISNSDASDFTETTANFNGLLSLIAYGEGNVWVYWGESDAGTVKGSWDYNQAFGLQEAGLLSTNITGLTEGETYYYRYYASNSMGAAWATSTYDFFLIADDHAVLSYLMGLNGSESSYTLDTSGNDITGTVNNASYVTATNGFSGGYYFDGDNDCVFIPSNSVLDFAGDFYVDTWVDFEVLNEDRIIIHGDTRTEWLSIMYNEDVDGFRAKLSTDGGTYGVDSAAGTTDNNTQYSVGFGRSGTNIHLYINGLLAGTTAADAQPLVMTTQNKALGIRAGEMEHELRGWINLVNIYDEFPDDPFRTYLKNGAEVGLVSEAFRYNTVFTDAVSTFQDYVTVDLEFNGMTHDSSTNRFDITSSSSPTYTGDPTNGWADFDGSANYLQLPGEAAPWRGSKDWAFSVWVNHDTMTGNARIFDDMYENATNYSLAMFPHTGVPPTNRVIVLCSGNGTSYSMALYGQPVNSNAWTHYVCSRIDGEATLYQDGVDVSSSSNSFDNFASVNSNWTIGRWSGGGGAYLDGSLGEFQTWSRGLTATESTNLYDATRGQYGL